MTQPARRRFAYRKLIRDDILREMQAKGDNPVYRRLEGQELLSELRRKIIEEAGEMNVTQPDELIDGLADIQEIIDAFLMALGKTHDELRHKQEQKIAKHGGFTQRIYLETVDKLADDSWIPHLEANPDRYPELDI